MNITELRRRTDGRTRMVRVAGTQVYVRITRAEAEKLHARLGGGVDVDTTGEGLYAFIRPTTKELP